MPDCSDCFWRENSKCQAHEGAQREFKRPIPPPPTGACTFAIVEDYLKTIKPGMSVLEIGCGTWSKLKDHVLKVGATYEGLDVQKEYYGVPCIATRYENLANLSYPDNTFDLVIGNQTMEHWAEHGCDTVWGLYQCFRVTKFGGQVFMNVPFHFHGTKHFLNGDSEKLKEMFQLFTTDLQMITWGAKTEPLEPYYPHPNYEKLKNQSAYVVDFRAKKNKPLPSRITNRLGFRGTLARILHYSPSYNWYLLKQKAWRILKS